MKPIYTEFDYEKIKRKGTGDKNFESEDYKLMIFPFNKYEIKIKLTSDNKFIEIVEVKINKDFIADKRKRINRGYHDVEEYYID